MSDGSRDAVMTDREKKGRPCLQAGGCEADDLGDPLLLCFSGQRPQGPVQVSAFPTNESVEMGLLACLCGRVVARKQKHCAEPLVMKIRVSGGSLPAALGTAARTGALQPPRSFEVSPSGDWDRHSTLSLPF